MKHILSFITVVFIIGSINTPSAAQIKSSGEISGFRARVENKDLVIRWKSTNDNNSHYWVVQGSEEGKSFYTIGMVMGEDPKYKNTYIFRQKLKKIKPGYDHYRVVFMIKDATPEVSNVIQSL